MKRPLKGGLWKGFKRHFKGPLKALKVVLKAFERLIQGLKNAFERPFKGFQRLPTIHIKGLKASKNLEKAFKSLQMAL